MGSDDVVQARLYGGPFDGETVELAPHHRAVHIADADGPPAEYTACVLDGELVACYAASPETWPKGAVPNKPQPSEAQ